MVVAWPAGSGTGADFQLLRRRGIVSLRRVQIGDLHDFAFARVPLAAFLQVATHETFKGSSSS